jgi:hypothetical protein
MSYTQETIITDLARHVFSHQPRRKNIARLLGLCCAEMLFHRSCKETAEKMWKQHPSFNPNQQDKHVPKGSETNGTRTTLCQKDAFTAAHFLILVPQNKERPCHQEKLSLRGGVQPGSLPWLRRFMF